MSLDDPDDADAWEAAHENEIKVFVPSCHG